MQDVHTLASAEHTLPSLDACVRTLMEQGAGAQHADSSASGSDRPKSPTLHQGATAWSDAELADILTVLALGHALPRSESPFS
jgi:hypothetical protein